VRVRFAIGGALLAFVLPASIPAHGIATVPLRPATTTNAGLTVALPFGWRVVHRRLTPCADPAERLTVAGHGALLMFQERLHPVVGEFSPRPGRFELNGSPQHIECCAPLRRVGWFSNFVDNGRGFYVYVYLGRPGTRAQALAILDSLRVRPSRRAKAA
jgi:hypothetical protein